MVDHRPLLINDGPDTGSGSRGTTEDPNSSSERSAAVSKNGGVVLSVTGGSIRDWLNPLPLSFLV